MKKATIQLALLCFFATNSTASFAQTNTYSKPNKVEITMEMRTLNASEKVSLDQGLALAKHLTNTSQPLNTSQVQILYDVLLETKQYDENHMIALGLAFGDLMVKKSDMEWVRISDEYGEETGLSPQEYQMFIAPISMIQKRIDRHEHLSIATLRDDTIKLVNEQIASGELSKRK